MRDIVWCYNFTEPQNLNLGEGLSAPPYSSVQKAPIWLSLPASNSLVGTLSGPASFDGVSRWSQSLTLSWSQSLDNFQTLSLFFTWITVYRASLCIFIHEKSEYRDSISLKSNFLQTVNLKFPCSPFNKFLVICLLIYLLLNLAHIVFIF